MASGMCTRTSVVSVVLAIGAIGGGCSPSTPTPPATASIAHASERNHSGTEDAAFYVGEALVGDGNEVAHVDVMIGSKSGPVGTAFANAMANQKAGHCNLLVVLAPNTAVKPSTIAIPKVTISGSRQAIQLFGPAQFAIAKAVTESVQEGVIPKSLSEDWVIVCGVFIHFEAEDDKRIFEFNLEATKLAIQRAMNREPSTDDVLRMLPQTTAPFEE